MSSVNNRFYEFINRPGITNFENSTSVGCSDISSECTDQTAFSTKAKFGWDKFPGSWDGKTTSTPKDAWFLRLQKWTENEDVSRIESMFAKLMDPTATKEEKDTIIFDDLGNFYVDGGDTTERFMNPIMADKPLPQADESNRPSMYMGLDFTKNSFNTNTTLVRWELKNKNLLFNRKLTYFIRAMYNDGGKFGYGLYYNPIHRKSMKDVYDSAITNGDDTAIANFTKIVNNYCDATTSELNPASDLSSNRWGDPSCGCTKNIEITGSDYGYGDDSGTKRAVFNRYFNDGFNNSYSIQPLWPYNKINNKDEFDNLVDFVNTNGDQWEPRSPCYAPACVMNTNENSFVNSFRKSKKTDAECSAFQQQNVTINNCNIGLDTAGEQNISGTSIGCNNSNDGNGCDAGSYHRSDDVCDVCPVDTYTGTSGLDKCIKCPDGTSTNGLVGQTSCAQNNYVLILISGLTLLILIALIIYIFRDEIFGTGSEPKPPPVE